MAHLITIGVAKADSVEMQMYVIKKAYVMEERYDEFTKKSYARGSWTGNQKFWDFLCNIEDPCERQIIPPSWVQTLDGETFAEWCESVAEEYLNGKFDDFRSEEAEEEEEEDDDPTCDHCEECATMACDGHATDCSRLAKE
jgi:hypothetical protein